MNDSAWERLLDLIDVKFGVDRHGREEKPLEDKPELKQLVEHVEFERGGKQYRLERVTKPAILEKKSIYHRAAGSGVRFENIYDPESTTAKVTLLEKSGDDWQAVELEELVGE